MGSGFEVILVAFNSGEQPSRPVKSSASALVRSVVVVGGVVLSMIVSTTIEVQHQYKKCQ